MKSALVSLVLGFVLAVLAAELLLHLFPVSTGYDLVAVDDARPMVHGKPFFPYTYSKDWSFHLANSGVLNNTGFRASYDYVPDARALVVIGNSFIAADALDPRETITERLAVLLHRPAYGIGVDGFSLADYVEAARWATTTFDAHTLLILLTTGDLAHSCSKRSGAHYLKSENGTVTMMLVPREASPLKHRLNESKLFRYVYDNLRAASNWSKGWQRDTDDDGPPNPQALTGLLGCTDEPFESSATQFLLQSFHEIESARHARVIFLLAPGYRFEQGVAAGAIRDVDVFAQRASLDGFEVIRLSSAFSAALRAGIRLDFWPIDGHWNAAGHAIAAGVAAPVIGPR